MWENKVRKIIREFKKLLKNGSTPEELKRKLFNANIAEGTQILICVCTGII
ncbi:MAG: hypothetical protein PHS93_08145 [Candidatus Omnitrophica bacterium]|nr:hypothetical protein [Candidatus Omnitrophota bacterium]